jgi:ABC-2 type transport system ATP-binding protein
MPASNVKQAVGRILVPIVSSDVEGRDMNLITIEHLSKHFRVLNRREGLAGTIKDLFSTNYRIVRAVDDISTEIQAGEIVGYIGPNGAGKSTTIKMMTGILQPTDGVLLVDGNVPHRNRKKNAQTMGVVFGQRTQLWWDLPVIESFKILKEIYRIDDVTYRRQLGLFDELVDLRALYDKQVRTLSLGQRMVCDIAASFLHSPKVVFLDEPTIGLDVSVKSKIRGVIKQLNEEQHTTIILTTHDLRDVEALCRRIIIIDKGKIIYDGNIREVTELFGAYRTLKVQIFDFSDGTMDVLASRLTERFGWEVSIKVENTEPGWTDVTINQDEVSLLDVLSCLMAEFSVKDIRVVEMSVENVVQRIYDGALR